MPDQVSDPPPERPGAAEPLPTRVEQPWRRRTDATGELRRGAPLGRYLVLERLGAGGMGVVYAAYDPTLDRRVALKLLHGERLSAPHERERFRREALALARLAHPHVVTVYDAGEAGGEMYLATELVAGRTLGEWLEEGARDWRQVLPLLLQAGRGLEAAHAAGLVHRDFKPGNVLVGHDGRVRVSDFGLAREVSPTAEGPPAEGAAAAGEEGVAAAAAPAGLEEGRSGPLSAAVTRVGAVVGTPRYMAPEQFRGEVAGPRTDQFAFCVAAWEALYGEPPFAAGSLPERAAAASEGRLAAPREERGVPAAVRAALARGLAPRREARFASMAELLAALEAAARPRRRWLVAGAAAAALLLAAAVIWLSRPAPLLSSGGRVLVLPFADATAEGAGEGLHELVAAALDVLPGVAASPAGEALGMAAAGPDADPELLERWRQGHGADLVVAARLAVDRARYVVDYRFAGEDGVSRQRTVHAGEPLAAANELAARVGHLLVADPPVTDLRHVFSEDPFVNRLYAAGVVARDRGGPAASRHYFAAALDQDPSYHRARLALAEALDLQSEPERSAALIAEVEAASRAEGDRGLLAEALALGGAIDVERGRSEAAAHRLERALALYREEGDHEGEIDILLELAVLAHRTGREEAADARLDEAAAIATSEGIELTAARIENLRGLAAMDRGENEAARAHFERAEELLRRLGARPALAAVLGNLGLIAAEEGRYDAARALLTEELALQEDLGNEREIATNAVNQAWVAWRSGDCERVAPLVARGLRLVEQQGNDYLAAHLRLNGYLCAVERGELDGHETGLRRAVAMAEGMEDEELLAGLRLVLGEALARDGRAAEARAELAAARAADPSGEDPEGATVAALLEARIALLEGRCAAAVTTFERARREGVVWRGEDETLLARARACADP